MDWNGRASVFLGSIPILCSTARDFVCIGLDVSCMTLPLVPLTAIKYMELPPQESEPRLNLLLWGRKDRAGCPGKH